MKKLAIAFALALTTVTAACGSDETTPTPAADSGTPVADSGGTPLANEVTVKSNEFVPPSITIKVGQEVNWKWAGGTHNVVSGPNCMADAKFKSGSPVGMVGNTFKRTFDTAGTFEYFCEPHCGGGMKGTVVVQ